jgi:small ligand-binding sensory domain FIST
VAVVSISSLYDGGAHNPVNTVISVVTEAAAAMYGPIQNLVGCSSAGVISSSATGTTSSNGSNGSGSCRAVEWEGLPAVSVTLGIVPDTTITTFACSPEDVPDDFTHVSTGDWKWAIGLGQFPNMEMPTTTSTDNTDTADTSNPPPVFMIFPSTTFSTILDDLIMGMNMYYPGAQIAGGLASTVSSLSRAVMARIRFLKPCPQLASTSHILNHFLSRP